MGKTLITGMTGLVGGAFTAKYLEKNPDASLVALVRARHRQSAEDRVANSLEEQLAMDGSPLEIDDVLGRIKTLECDIVGMDAEDYLDDLEDVDAIFHCAADVNLGRDPNGETFNSNCRSAENIIELAKRLNVKALHVVSTAYVAGRATGVVAEDELIEEPVFNNAYEKSKYHSERRVRESGIPFTIYRPSIIVGRRRDGVIRKPLAFYRILEFLAKIKKNICARNGIKPNDELDLPLRIESLRSSKVYLVPIDYVQKALVELHALPVENKTYHLTGSRPVSTNQIQDTVRDTLKMPRISVMDKVEDPSRLEKMIRQFIGDLFPYFASQMDFSVDNVTQALGEESLTWDYGERELHTLIHCFYQSRFPEIFV